MAWRGFAGLGRDFWGKGVMSEAVRLFVRYAFSHFDLLRIEAGCFARCGAGRARVYAQAGGVPQHSTARYAGVGSNCSRASRGDVA